MNYTDYRSPIGVIRIFTKDDCIWGLYLQSQKWPAHFDESRQESTQAAKLATAWLDAYFSGLQPDPGALPLRPLGTPFQHKVWDLLLQIPYGQTVTYGQLAKSLGPRMSSQAVGQAVGRNPISIIIPCHRVMGMKNRLTGYAGGTEYKAWLLEHEGNDISKFIEPKKIRGK